MGCMAMVGKERQERGFCGMKRSGMVVALAVVIIAVLLFTSFSMQYSHGSGKSSNGAMAGIPQNASVSSMASVPSHAVSGSQAVVYNVSNYSSGHGGVPAFYSVYPAGGGYNFGAYPTPATISYPMVFPYGEHPASNFLGYPYNGFQNVSADLPPYMYQGNSQYNAEFATSLHWVANFTRIYPPSIDYFNGSATHTTGGMGPNYSLQFNIPFYSSVPGGESISWYQSAFGFNTINGTGNPHDPNASYFIYPISQWWLNYSKFENHHYSANWSHYNGLRVNPENPLIISSWLNISAVMRNPTNGSVFIYENDRVTGLLGNGYENSNYARRTEWFNTTFEIINGSKYGVDPFPVFLTGVGNTEAGYTVTSGANGIAFVGAGNGQVVWGNYTATFGVAEDVGGTLLPVSGAEGVQSSTGEGSEGAEGVPIMGSETNPLGLPPYFPYTYNSNQSGGPLRDSAYNIAHESAASSVIVGNVFPSSAVITAYAVYTHSYIPVVKNGTAFYVDFPGLYGMNSSNIIIGGLSLDYWSPIVFNFSSPGFQSTSVTVTPYREPLPYIEVRAVQAVLVPAEQKMVYGFLSLPFSYFSYFAGRYISTHYSGIGELHGNFYANINTSQSWELLRDIQNISENVSSYFWMNVSGSNGYANESWYLPYVVQPFLRALWSNNWAGQVGAYSLVYGHDLLFGGPMMIPYYVVIPSSSLSISVGAPILSGTVSVPSGTGAYEENISLGSFNVPLTVHFPSLPENYNSAPPSISSVSMNGKTVWSGNSTNATVVLEVPLNSIASPNVDNFTTAIGNYSYSPGANYYASWYSSLPSFYYNANFTITPSSPEYAPVNISRVMMVFNYSVYPLVLGLGKDPANTSQVFPFSFPKVQVGVGGSDYSVVKGYLYGVYNLTGQKFVLGGVTVQFFRNGILVDSVVTGSNGYYSANMSFAPASAWGSNATISVDMQAGDMQFTNFSGTVYLHADKVEWRNASMLYVSTINMMGYGVTIPGWFVNDILTLLLGSVDVGIYIVVLYFLMVVGIGVGAATGGGFVMGLIMKKTLKTGVSKGGGAVKGTAGQVKPGNKQ